MIKWIRCKIKVNIDNKFCNKDCNYLRHELHNGNKFCELFRFDLFYYYNCDKFSFIRCKKCLNAKGI